MKKDDLHFVLSTLETSAKNELQKVINSENDNSTLMIELLLVAKGYNSKKAIIKRYSAYGLSFIGGIFAALLSFLPF